MDSDRNDRTIKSIFEILDRDIVPHVKRNGKKVEDFIEKFKDVLPKGYDGYVIHLLHCGSAYERLVVKKKTDFDIIVMLGDPFDSDDFTISRDKASGFFTLQWKSHSLRKPCSDWDNYLDAGKLRYQLFTAIGNVIAKVKIPNAEINYREQLVALTVEIKFDTGEIISIDFVPEIVLHTWGRCPGLIPLGELPKCVKDYIDTQNKGKSPIVFFPLAVPDADQYANSDQLFNVSFCKLEKDFLNHESNGKLRGMVRMVKLVAYQRNWKKLYKFRSFFAKRIAIKHCDELMAVSIWKGYKVILSYLAQKVENGIFDSYFIKDRVIYKWKPEIAFAFRRAIAAAFYVDPTMIRSQMLSS